MNTPLVTALSAALVHFVWQGLGLALLVALFRPRYRWALTALLAMPLAFFATIAVSWPTAGFGLMPPSRPEIPWLVPVWLLGMSCIHLRNLGAWLAVQQLRRSGAIPADTTWQQRVAELGLRLGVDHAVALLETCRVEVPVVAGVLRPVILMPAGMLMGLPTEHLEYLLLHELAHIRRFDYAVNLLQKAIEGLLFYHPAVWWVSKIVRDEREHCCDDMVLAQGADPRSYAETLASLETARLSFVPAANGGSLARRVRRILGYRESGSPALTAMLATAVIACTLLLAAATPYDKWLTEDVVYIITKAEREAFVRLPTDQEKEHFIEQFWQRRPAAFKAEHYRRIAKANERFQEPEVGWKTDRGRIYITYGPPDEIDAHPADFREEWLYKQIEGVGRNVKIEFVDGARDGHYRMTMDPHR